MTTAVAIAGSTGSIGTQALDVVRSSEGQLTVAALSARSSVDLLVEQVAEFRPRLVVLDDESSAREVASRVAGGTEVVLGPDGPAAMAEVAAVVLNGVVGFAGLSVTVAALEAGRRLALANKESLVAGGPVVAAARQRSGAEIVPVDSEHAALHQCLRGERIGEVARLLLTASGGPFRGRSAAELAQVSVEDALAHPTWQMGPKISVDSSTLMNKGLEVIEAEALFGVGFDRIEVVVHPQSVVHSMVELIDGSTIAQLSQPDMRAPIAYALGFPDRWPRPYGRLDWPAVGPLTFEAPDLATFPCLGLAYEAGRAGGSAPAWLNAANEVAVAAFLRGALAWRDIPDVLRRTLDLHDGAVLSDVADVIEADGRARVVAAAAVAASPTGAPR